MAFSEKLKQKVKEHAHFKCCLCRKELGTNVHHIIPQAEGGTDEEENAVPLCPTCHFEYGNNPDMRKFIKQNRDFWYKQCEKASPPDMEMIKEIHEHIHKEVVTKTDLDNALKPIYNILGQDLPPSEQRQQISAVTAAVSDAIVLSLGTVCPDCGFSIDIDASTCPRCGWPDNRYD